MDLSGLFIVVVFSILAIVLLSKEKEFKIEPRNWFSGSRTGSWTDIAPREKQKTLMMWTILTFVLLFAFGAIMENVMLQSVYYLAMFVFYASAWQISASGAYSGWVAVFDGTYKGDFPNFVSIFRGVIFGVIMYSIASYIFMSGGQTASLVPFVLAASGVGLSYILLRVLLVGFTVGGVEEAFFRGFLLPTITEFKGIVFGVLSVSAIFSIFHITLRSASSGIAPIANIPFVIFSFFFSVVACLLALTERSFLGVGFMHITYNTLFVLSQASVI